MTTIEFTTDLTESPVLAIPPDVLARLPKSGRVRVLLVADDETDEWHRGVYEQFARDDSAEDDVYDSLA